MALKTSQLFYSIFLFFIFFSAFGHAKTGIPSDKKSSPLDFKLLEGCQKGNHTKGIHHLKSYFQTFGYLEYTNQTHSQDDDFDDALESALKIYQENYDIKPTGILDATTISKLTTPRCGVPDIINGTNYMRSHKRKHGMRSSTIHIVSHYSFFNGSPTWPPTKRHLTYRFLSNVPTYAIAPVESGFQKWVSVTNFTFSQVQTDEMSDLQIGFFSGEHGDGLPFGGLPGPTAHAFSPTNGRFHYNSNVSWSVSPTPTTFHLESIAVHEIGHLLGLYHSDVVEAIMYPYLNAGEVKTNLHPDDIAGIQDLYDI